MNAREAVVAMSSPRPRPERGVPDPRHEDLREQARRKGVRPVRSAEDLAADVFESDEELDEFLAALREWRRSG
jgi:hypothetical protein